MRRQPRPHQGSTAVPRLPAPADVPRHARPEYDAWIAARADTRAAYRWWMMAPQPLRGEAYAVYLAAADREDAATSAYARAEAA
jgi:hypothetical protein